MKYKELFVMLEGLKEVDAPGSSTDFLFAVAVNKRELEILVKDLHETIKAEDEFVEFLG